MKAIAARLDDGGTGRICPDTWEAMEAKVGKELLGCPLTAEERAAYPDGEAMARYPFYAVPDWPEGKSLPREIPRNFILLYEKYSVAPNADQGERASVNVLRRADAPIDLRIRDVKILLEIMYRWAAVEEYADRLDAEKKYSSAMGMALARR